MPHIASRWSIRLTTFALFLVAPIAGACHDPVSPPVRPTPIELVVADMTAGEASGQLELMRAQGLPTMGMSGLLLPPIAGREHECRREGDAYHCAPWSTYGMTVERAVTFYDALGAVQGAFDSLATASVRFSLLIVGGTDSTNSLRRQHTLVATGLLGSESTATWNGEGSLDARRTGMPPDDMMPPGGMMGGSTTMMGGSGGMGRDGGLPAEVRRHARFAVEDVVTPVPMGPGTWPLSGTIRHASIDTLFLSTGEVRVLAREASIVFDGSQYATVTVNGRAMKVDLAVPRRGMHGAGGGPDGLPPHMP